MRYPLASVLALLAMPAAAADAVDYQRDVKPLLFHKCAACHGALKQSAGLRLDAGVLARAGGDSGPAIQVGDSAASLLIQRVAEPDPDLRMPPAGEGEALTADQIRLLSNWIDQGAESPDDEPIPEDPTEYWSYQPPVRPPIPAAPADGWARNAIDIFIAAQHRRRQLTPQPEAPREVWLRRVYLDLIGLPPTREQLQAFLADDSATAYERVVDALLARPEYGERWGRHWMDVWRYSDWYGSRGGNEIRYSQRHIWRWRDWIIQSLAADKPYDQMLREMLAGDELAPSDPQVLRATGFLGRNWYKFDRNVWMFDTVEHTSQALLGLTLRCARCHDHKFDPISQEDYYRFRAFFEPHGVRTDPLAADTPREKDATLGMVLTDGVARVFDQNADAPTYLFRRGDDRSPDTSRPLTPGVPGALQGPEIQVQPVSLPIDAYYPSLRPEIAEGLIAASGKAVDQAQQRLAAARDQVACAQQAVTDCQDRINRGQQPSDGQVPPVLSDDFATRSDVWQIISGAWSWQDGKLVESSVGSFATVVASVDIPRDFEARISYRTLQPGNYRSVGFSFDFLDVGNSQDVYTSANDAAPSIQAFHRQNGKQVYPSAGIVKTPLSVGQVVTVQIAARGQQLTVLLDGQHKLDYVMPTPRRAGKFALWVHNGSAEFLNVEIRPVLPTLADLRRQQQEAVDQMALAECQLQTAEAELAALRARIAAEQAKYAGQPEQAVALAATEASRAERHVAVLKARQAVLQAQQHRAAVVAAQATADNAAVEENAAVAEADKKLAEAQQSLEAAETAHRAPDGIYTPLGEVFPATSTGRRLALARWITDRQNPRTARVAVNHIWLRHFGQAIVPTVANFGLNGQPPSHPELLDWLAVELMDRAWRMKPLHRLIVLSATYRQSSAAGDDPAAMASDPDNRYLWRMNSRRMEAEVVRDSVLFTAGTLDPTPGGPEIPESAGQTVPRRSLYFRNTPNETMPFLKTFDAPNPNECYRRQESVVPHQALALMNSGLALDQARILAARLSRPLGEADDPTARGRFVTAAWETVLNRLPTQSERAACQRFLEQHTLLVQGTNEPRFAAGAQTAARPPSSRPYQRARENLVHVLFSHNDFVTIR